MIVDRRVMLTGAVALARSPRRHADGLDRCRIDTPMAPPRWASLQRQLLAANMAACEAFYAKYVDANDALQVLRALGSQRRPRRRGERRPTTG